MATMLYRGALDVTNVLNIPSGALGLTWADAVAAAPYLFYAALALALCLVVALATRGAARRQRAVEAALHRQEARLRAREAELWRLYQQRMGALAAQRAAPATRPFPPDHPAARPPVRSVPRTPMLAPPSGAVGASGMNALAGLAAAPTVPLYPTPPTTSQPSQQQRARLQVNDALNEAVVTQRLPLLPGDSGALAGQWTDPHGQSTGEMRWRTWSDEPEGHPAPLEGARARAERRAQRQRGGGRNERNAQ